MNDNNKNYTIQDVFNEFYDSYLECYNVSSEQKKAANSIMNCRTKNLGSHTYKCTECGEEYHSYNSCKDRHCPRCQLYKKEVWINNRVEDILDVIYYHVVVTVPQELKPLIIQNKKEMYNLIMKCSAETIMELCMSEKYLNAKPGITSMLHTWNQKGDYHPHVHMIVTGGGINNMNQWVEAKDDYFLPVLVISRKFRGKLLSYIKESDKLKFYNNIEYLNNKKELNKYLTPLYKKDWVVYCKPPFKNVGETYEYLGRYAFRVCMSDERVINIEDGYVTFKYKDRKHGNKVKYMKVRGEEFIRRFLLHILPKGFLKIRYYGLMASKGKKDRIKELKIKTKTITIRKKLQSKIEILNKMMGRDITKCEKCNGELILILETKPIRHNKSGPPSIREVIMNAA